MRPRTQAVDPTRLTLADTFREAAAAITARPTRSALTSVGTVLGVASFVVIVGLAQTASAQIDSTFSAQQATQVEVALSNPSSDQGSFPDDSDERIQRLNGVLSVGQRWTVSSQGLPMATTVDPSDTISVPVTAATPGYLRAIEPSYVGTLFTDYQQDSAARVAVIGAAAAQRLGVHLRSADQVIYINGVSFVVAGIIEDVVRDPAELLGVTIPARTALLLYGQPDTNTPPSMLIRTHLGASALVARQAPLAIDPTDPGSFTATFAKPSTGVRDAISGQLASVFLALAAVSLIIGGVGIANTTLVSVLERTSEIGLRRALGARRAHVGRQFMVETLMLGGIGGLTGAALGVLIIVSTCVSRSWTPVVSPVLTAAGPLFGLAVGLVAGAYPALRASHIRPSAALRR